MKKTLLFVCFALCFVALFTSCLEPGEEDLFNPPSWIRGTWEDSTATLTYTFTTHGISTSITSPYHAIAILSGMYEDNDVVETITDSLYEFTVSDSGVFMISYHFQKLTATTLNYTRINAAGTVGPMELTKE